MNHKARKRIRAEIAEAQGWRCWYCQIGLSPETATLEHFVPIVRGGTDNPENLVVACQPCNQEADELLPYQKEALRR